MPHPVRWGLAACVALSLTACTATSGEQPPTAATTPGTTPSPTVASPSPAPAVDHALADLEDELDARIGVAALDTGTDETVEHRADERWGYASTVKVFVVAELLRTTTAEQRAEQVTWSQEDVDAAGYAPVTGDHVDGGLTLDELAEAAVRDSDNAATNILFEHIGGPEGLRAAFERLGDRTTEPARTEPDLNTVEPGSTADTTTPAAFTADLDAVLHGGRLDPQDVDRLVEWMTGNATGDALVRAGAPDGWTVADKSGGAGALRHDVAVVTPPGREPIVLTVLTEREDADAGSADALVEQVAATVLDRFR
ncbi:class A beta-lactamase [Isoptericola halotolerans]|uniref:class A beta-lactamase n=1 Tax=Isoptericola halotolerans TaxID=300560 RepID=UPI003890EB92